MTLNSLEEKKRLQKLIYSIFIFLSSEFLNFYVFLFLELFLDEPAMVLRYMIASKK
jgi:hypothetical protein